MKNTATEKRENVTLSPERMDQGLVFTPLVDIIENTDEFIFQADMPGVRAEDLDVSFDNGVLTIDGRVTARRGGDQPYLWREYEVGSFYRQFTLDTPVNRDGINAQLCNGELTVHVPKAEAAKPRRIEVKSA